MIHTLHISHHTHPSIHSSNTLYYLHQHIHLCFLTVVCLSVMFLSVCLSVTFFCSTRSPIPPHTYVDRSHHNGHHDNDDDNDHDDATVYWDSLLLRPLPSETVPPLSPEAVSPYCSSLAVAEASADLRRRLTLARPRNPLSKGVSGADQRGVLKEGLVPVENQVECTQEDLRHQEEIGCCALQLAQLEQTHMITTLQQTVLKQLLAIQCPGDGDDSVGDRNNSGDMGDNDADGDGDDVLQVADAIVHQLTHTGTDHLSLLS